MKKGKRVLSLLLAIVLVIGLLPTTVFAKVLLPEGSDKADGVDMTSGGAVTISRTTEPLFKNLIKEYRGGNFTDTNAITNGVGTVTKDGKATVAYCVEHGKNSSASYAGTADASTKNQTVGLDSNDNAWLNGVMKAGYPNQSGTDILIATMMHFTSDPTNSSSSGKFTEKYDDGQDLGTAGKSLWDYFNALGATGVTLRDGQEPELKLSDSNKAKDLDKYAELATQLAVWHAADQVCLGTTLSFAGGDMNSWPDIKNQTQRTNGNWTNPDAGGVPVIFFNGMKNFSLEGNAHSDVAKAVLLMATYLLCAGKDAAAASTAGKASFPLVAVDKSAGVTPSTSVSVDLKNNATYAGKKTMTDVDAENGDAGFTVTEGTPYTASQNRAKDSGVIRTQGLWLQATQESQESGYYPSVNGLNGDNYGAMYFAVITDTKPEDVTATPTNLVSASMALFNKSGGVGEHAVIAFVDPNPNMDNYDKKTDDAGKTVNLNYMGSEFYNWTVTGESADNHVPKELLIWNDGNADTSHRGELHLPWAKVTKASVTRLAEQGKLINQFGLGLNDLQDGQEYWILVGKFLTPDWAQNPGYYYEDFLKSLTGTSYCDWSGNGKPATDATLSLDIKGTEQAVYRAKSTDDSYQDVIFWGKTPKESKVSVNYKWDGIRFKPVANPPENDFVTVKLHKTDSASGKSLAGATFSAQSAEGCSNHNTIYTATTGTDGIARFATDAGGSNTTLLPKQCIVGYTEEGAPIYGPCTHTWTVWESQPPAGYMSTGRTETFTLSDGETDFGQPNWPNTPVPDPTSFSIMKVDADDTTKVVPGAVFHIKNVDTGDERDYTATTGILTFHNDQSNKDERYLPNGSYVVTEKIAPYGYELSNEVLTFNFNDYGTSPSGSLIFADHKKPSLVLTKYDANSRHTIPGVTFNYWVNDQHKGTVTTNDLGRVEMYDLETGTYTFQESSVPAGYIKSNEKYSIYVDTNSTQKTFNLSIANYAKKSLVITKEDATTGEKLAGAEFEVKCLDSSFVTTVTTGSNGTVTVPGLDYGTYTITETQAPTGYSLSAKPYTVVLNESTTADTIQVPAFKDNQKHQIKLVKLDANTGEGIPGVTFEYTYNGQDMGETEPTDDAGVTRVSDLETGTYTFQEARVPNGYIKSDKTYSIYIDLDTLTEDKVHLIPVENYAEKTLIIAKVDATTGEKLAGAEFEIKSHDKSFETRAVTDASGTATVTGLHYGTYIITETKAPVGYELTAQPQTVVLDENSPDDVIEVPAFLDDHHHHIKLTKLDANSGKGIPGVIFSYYLDDQYIGDTGPTDNNGVTRVDDLAAGTYTFKESKVPSEYIKSDQTFTVHVDTTDRTENKIHEVTVQNYLKKTIIITKEDATTGEKLAGAEFRIEGKTNNVDTTVTTGKDGTAKLTGLDYGTYIITETKAPVGYELSAQPYTLILNETTTEDVINVPVFKDNQKHQIRLVKLDANSQKPIPGVVFDYWVGNTYLGHTPATDEDGVIVLTDLVSGDYKFKESFVPASHIKSEQEYTLHIDLADDNPNKIHPITITNYLKKSLVITKEDATTGAKLAGAEFRVQGVDSDYMTTVTTGPDGSVTLSGLDYGTYTITETKAPVGYELSAEPQTVVLDAANTTDDVITVPTFQDNQKHTITLTKLDANSGRPIQGVTFDYWINGKAHGQVGPTDANGQIVMENVDSGTYTFKEATVPSSYIKSDKTYTVEVDLSEPNENKVHALTIKNYLKKTVVLIKEDSTTGKRLAGAEFDIKGVNNDFATTVTTGEDGTVTLSGLGYGTYIITETKAPAGYELSAEPYTLVLDETTTTDDVLYIPIFRDNQKHTIIITKIDANSHQPIPGVTFDHWIDGKTHEQVGPTDEKGQIVMENVDSGTHTFKEAAVPSDYIKSDKTYTVEVDLTEPNENKIHELTIENYLKKTIVITKEDSEQGWKLAGARFEVKGVDNDFFDTVETDETGTATVDGMVYGTYTVTETRAPAGYEVATEPYTLILNETTTDDVIIVPTFQDDPEPGLMIRKVDSTTKQAIPNVTFRVELLADGGSYTKEYITDANGLIIIPDVQIGWYRITEVSTPDGYVPSNASKTIQVTATNTPTTVTFENDQLNALNILKLESKTGLPLAGAVFEVRKASGELVATVTTGANGYATVPNLAPGAYVVTEMEAPDHHVIDPKPQAIEVSAEDAGKTYLLVFRNSDMASIYIRKVDADTNQGVAGAVFKVETSAGTVVAENVVTGEGGLVLVDRLVAGTYIITETQAPDGYLLNAPAQVVAIEDGQTKTVTFRDNKPGGIDILKQDAATATVLPGAEFALYDINDNPIGGPYVTGEDGIAHIPGLEPGLYLIKETKAPDGYQCDGQPIKVEVKPFRTTTVTVPNTQKSALTIEKRDKETNVLLEGAVFTVTTQDGAVVAKDLVTGKGGTVTVNGLAEGNYYVTEAKAPDGYLLNDTPQLVTTKGDEAAVVTVYDQVMKNLIIRKVDSETNAPLSGAVFELRKQDGTLVGTYTTDSSGAITTQALEPGYYTLVETYAPDGYVAGWVPGAETGSTVAGGSAVTSQTIQIVDGETTVVTIPNTPLPVIEIRKTDAVTGEPLMGAEFTVANEQGNVVGVYTTDSTGGVFTKRLAPGYYTITETKAPTGYLADAEPQRVKLEAGQPIILTFTDQPRTSLLITKVDDATEAPLAGAVFELKAADGSVVGTYTTGENGTVSTAPLEPGNYKLTETTTPDGYMPDHTVYDVTIQAGSANSITIRNRAFPSLTVFKGDSTGKPLPGATIKLETADGDWVAQGVTDAAGEVIFTGLKPGHYIVTETKAPTGYEMVSDPVVTNVEYGKVNRVELLNAQWGGLLIKLTDQADGKALANGQFTVTHCADNTIVFTGTTDTAGTILVGSLIPGHKYIITQTMAPDGYTIVDREKSEFVAAGENRLVLFEDTTAGIVIEKVDAITGKTLAGARFQLTRNSDNIVIGEYVTGTDGLALASGLIPGMYTVEELEAPENYTIDEAPKLVHVKANETAHVTFKDTPYSGITLRSIDSATDKPVAGTVFEVYVQNGELVGRYTTDSTGTVETDVLGPGHYVVKQVYVPDGYEAKADTERVVEVKDGVHVEETFYLVPAGTLTIYALDNSYKGLPGMRATVTKINGEFVTNVLTDDTGTASVTGLTPGYYVVTETQAPNGYIIGVAQKNVLVSAGAPASVYFAHDKTYGLQILTTVAQTGNPLADVQYQVTKPNGEIVKTYASDEAGYIYVPLAPGDYVVTPVYVPDGYTVGEGQKITVVNANQYSTVKFVATQLSSVRVQVVDGQTGQGLYGVRLLVKDATGKVLDECWTDNEGKVVLSQGLVDGTYTLEQITVPDGYAMDSVPKTIQILNGQTTEVVWQLFKVAGQIQVELRSADYNSVLDVKQGTLLAGGVFEVVDPVTYQVVATMTSDAYGVAASQGLPLGRYLVRQLSAPDYYANSDQVTEVTLKIPNDVVRVNFVDPSLALSVSIDHKSNVAVSAGQMMRVDVLDVSNKSNVALTNSYWTVKVPTDCARISTFYTGSWDQMVWYSVSYKTNMTDYRELAKDLASTANNQFDLSSTALGLQAGEYVTDVRFEFPTVPAGFHLVQQGAIMLYILPEVYNNYQVITRMEYGGKYSEAWVSNTSLWTTTVVNPNVPTGTVMPGSPQDYNIPSTLPKTGY